MEPGQRADSLAGNNTLACFAAPRRRGAAARVFRRVGLHERSASRRTHYFLLDRFTVTGLFYARTLPLVSCSVTPGQVVLDQHADYVLVVKDNQPRLHAELVAYFADPRATARSATTTDRCHGRTETRTLHVTTRLCPYLTQYFPFPQIGQVARLVRAVREKGQTRTETAYLITSLTPRRATPTRLLALIRGHGSVEVRHRLRDVTFGEDHSRLRGGAAPQIMAALRTLALTLIRRAGETAIAAHRRHLAAHPSKALRLLRPKTHSRR